MKYGQQFADTLSASSESFQAASIDYKKLKKSIKRIESELQSLGLNAELLKQLLNADGKDDDEPSRKDERLPRTSSRRSLTAPSTRSRKRRHSRARAEYELAGTVDNPVPRIKLVFSSASSESASSSADDEFDLYDRLVSADSAQITEINESTEDDEVEPTPDTSETEDLSQADDITNHEPHTTNQKPEMRVLMNKMYGMGISPIDQVTPPSGVSPTHPNSPPGYFGHINGEEEDDDDDGKAILLQGPDIVLNGQQMEKYDDADVEGDKNDETASISETIRVKRRKRRPRRERREIIVNIAYDSEFFLLLNQALASLAALLDDEKKSFIAAVERLAKVIATYCSPSKNQSDLYVWREIFSLWVEAEIFESERERDRGQRPIEEIERRMDWFVDQVGRRKLAKKMKKKEGRAALEKFVELNQELVNLKRIGLANREAARKILKKHDKRLGLSASQDFPDFIKQQQQQLTDGSMQVAKSALTRTAEASQSETLIFTGLTTLPHVLLSNFTEILLPIIPQIDDYSCLICGDIAWRPIALDCGHHFCVRCLVKMQKRAQDACPACRAPVVMKANKDNLDLALQEFQKRWFPREIKAKEKESGKEIAKEIQEELDLDSRCIIA